MKKILLEHIAQDDSRFEDLKKRLFRVETLLWILTGTGIVKFGSDVLPMVSAILN